MKNNYPHRFVMAFAYANDGFKLYFMTGHACQKVQNIQRCNKVSLTVDRECEDWEQIKGLSMGGMAAVLSE
ncbi:pyridoxamine 5'-phosphate oxidase family protein [Leptothoe sp. EHU-05/26/07-4]